MRSIYAIQMEEKKQKNNGEKEKKVVERQIYEEDLKRYKEKKQHDALNKKVIELSVL